MNLDRLKHITELTQYFTDVSELLEIHFSNLPNKSHILALTSMLNDQLTKNEIDNEEIDLLCGKNILLVGGQFITPGDGGARSEIFVGVATSYNPKTQELKLICKRQSNEDYISQITCSYSTADMAATVRWGIFDNPKNKN